MGDILISIAVEQIKSGSEPPLPLGECNVIAVPRVGEFLDLVTQTGEEVFGRVRWVRHTAEAKDPFVGDASILVTIEVEK